MQWLRNSLITVVMLSLTNPVLAHTGVGSTHGFVDGLIHPLRGVDHLLVMLATGFWASLRAGNKIWQLPFIFLLAMLSGAGLQIAGLSIQFAEQAIILSVLVFGLIIGFNLRTSTLWASGFVAVFAFIHGYVHAVESTTGDYQMAYLFGFLSTTASLLSLGIVFGTLNVMVNQGIRIGFGIISTVIGLALCIG